MSNKNHNDSSETTGRFDIQPVDLDRELSRTGVTHDIGRNRAGLVIFLSFAALFVGFGVWDILSIQGDLAHKCETTETFTPFITAITVGLSAATGYFFGSGRNGKD